MAQMYRVAEFARLAGVTVRTLQYYDRIGLLKPTTTTEAGYRLYTQTDLLQLQQIVALKYLGFSLDEINHLRQDPTYDLPHVLELQKQAINEQIIQLQHVTTALDQTLYMLNASAVQETDLSLVCQLLQGTLEAEKWRWIEQYYTSEQWKQLTNTHQDVSPQQLIAWQQEWQELIAAFQDCYDRHVEPSALEVQQLTAQADILIEIFTQGDTGIRQALRSAYEDLEQMPPEHPRPYPVELQRFIGKAQEIYQERKNG
ncbi:MAG: MerR family transcriptional regulator [Chloroflexota bacterium]